MRMRGPGAGAPTYRRLGAWTVTLDDAGPERVDVLADLLPGHSSVHRIPPLERGWFTGIALAEPDAVNLFAEEPSGPVVRSGILQVSPARPWPWWRPHRRRRTSSGRSAPRSRCAASSTCWSGRPAIDAADLTIAAVPAGMDVEGDGALATLVRPNFTLVVRASS